MRKLTIILLALGLFSANAYAADYVIDKKGMHASIQFKISHLGYSWLWGRFNDFDGQFSYDKDQLEKSRISVTIKTASVDSNHAERDKHLRDKKFLHVEKFPESRFVSTAFEPVGDGSAILKGDFTLRGVTRPIEIKVKFIGEGKDPWGGYRAGFEGTTRIALADYGIMKKLGPASKELDLFLAVEGVRKDK